MVNDNLLINKLEKARFHIFTKEPFLGYVLQHYPIYLNDDIATAATNGEFIYFGRQFLDDLSIQETIFVLLHELLHIILEHPLRKGDRDHMRFNIACDIVINDILKSYGFASGNINPIYGTSYGIHGHLYTVEQVYSRLPKRIKYVAFDSHILWEEMSESEKNQMRHIIEKAKQEGYTSHQIEKHIRKIHQKYTKSHVNWKNYLSKYLEHALYDYTFERIDRRYQDILLPEFNKSELQLESIWFLVDVSGSMSKETLSNMYSEMMNIIKQFRNVTCDISFFSTMVTEPKSFRNKQELMEQFNSITSTMGTSFQIIFEMYQSHYKKNKPKAIIILTDGEAKFPNNYPNIPIIWAINNKNITAPFGHTIHI